MTTRALGRTGGVAALLFSLACNPCAPTSGPGAPSPAPRPGDVLPLSALCDPCDDFRRSRELAVEHTRKGMAADDPYLFAQTGTCDGFERILFFQAERGPVRELFFSGGALVAGRETGKGASRWFGRQLLTMRPVEGDPGHEESLCSDAHGLRQEASATLSHRRGVLVFRGGPVGWGRFSARAGAAQWAEARAGWLRSMRVQPVAAGSSGSLTVVLGAGSPEDLALTFRYAIAARPEDGRLALVEAVPDSAAVEAGGETWPKGVEKPLEVLRFEDEGFPANASMRRLERIRLSAGKRWGDFVVAYHPILE